MNLRILIATGALLGFAAVATADDKCAYEGQSYSHGASICQAGTQYRCDDGEWQSQGMPCPGRAAQGAGGAGDAPIVPATGAKSCTLGDSTVSSASTVCKSGVTFLCTDGEWQSLGTPCR